MCLFIQQKLECLLMFSVWELPDTAGTRYSDTADPCTAQEIQ